MITYDPGKWFGFHKLIQMRGSVVYAVMPRCLFSAGMVIWVHYQDLVYFPRSPYAHQMFTFGMSFLVIMRTNLSYSRYWEGISELVTMHSKWTDAVQQIIAFDELASGAAATAGEKFRNNIVHIMSLMSTCMVLKFQEGGLAEIRANTCIFDVEALLRETAAMAKGTAEGTTPQGTGGDQEAANFDNEPLPIIGGVTEEECQEVLRADAEGCAVHYLMHKLVRLLSRRHKAGGLAAPPPIVSRIFQELSNGFLGYQGAHKVSSIPFPFPYAQIVQYLQLAFVLSCPFVVVAFVDELFFQCFFTFLGVFTFCSLNAVASQLEDPFGHDDNDLPLRMLHHNFVKNLSQLQRTKLSQVELDCIEGPADEPSPAGSPDVSPSKSPSPSDEAMLEVGAKRLMNEVNLKVQSSNGAVMHEEALRELFDAHLDKDGNGHLDHAELRVLCARIGLGPPGFSEDKYVHMLKKVDPRGTGAVSFDAFCQWFMKKHKKHMKKLAESDKIQE